MSEDGYCPYVTVYELEPEDPQPSPVLGLDGLPVCWYQEQRNRIGFRMPWWGPTMTDILFVSVCVLTVFALLSGCVVTL